MSGRIRGRIPRARVVTAVLAVLVGLSFAAVSVMRVAGSGVTPRETLEQKLADPTYTACMAEGQYFCDPVAKATYIAGNPAMHLPSANPQYLTRGQAIAKALPLAAQGNRTPAAPPTSPIRAEMMSAQAFSQRIGLPKSIPGVYPTRMVWVVTVQAPTGYISEESGRFVSESVYTVSFDAETGKQVWFCLGCDTLP